MIGRPETSEAAPYYFKYIDKVSGDDPRPVLIRQLDETLAWCATISEERSLYRYAPEKWSIREALSHISDTERAFAFRMLWFARGFDTALPSFDQEIAVANAKADAVAWSEHVEDFRRVRLATISLLQNLPQDAWMRTGVASGHRVSVRAIAFLTAGISRIIARFSTNGIPKTGERSKELGVRIGSGFSRNRTPRPYLLLCAIGSGIGRQLRILTPFSFLLTPT